MAKVYDTENLRQLLDEYDARIGREIKSHNLYHLTTEQEAAARRLVARVSVDDYHKLNDFYAKYPTIGSAHKAGDYDVQSVQTRSEVRSAKTASAEQTGDYTYGITIEVRSFGVIIFCHELALISRVATHDIMDALNAELGITPNDCTLVGNNPQYKYILNEGTNTGVYRYVNEGTSTGVHRYEEVKFTPQEAFNVIKRALQAHEISAVSDEHEHVTDATVDVEAEGIAEETNPDGYIRIETVGPLPSSPSVCKLMHEGEVPYLARWCLARGYFFSSTDGKAFVQIDLSRHSDPVAVRTAISRKIDELTSADVPAGHKRVYIKLQDGDACRTFIVSDEQVDVLASWPSKPRKTSDKQRVTLSCKTLEDYEALVGWAESYLAR